MNRFLDPYGTLGPVRRQVIGNAAFQLAILAVFGMLALRGFTFVIVATSFFYFMPVSLAVGNLDRIGVSETSASQDPPRTQNLAIIYLFLVLACWIALDFVGQSAANFAVTVGMPYEPNRWPYAVLASLGPMLPMLLRIRRASWLVWQSKMQPEVQP